MLASFHSEFYLNYTVSIECKDFPALSAIFKDFQGLKFLFQHSRTFKVHANPVIIFFFHLSMRKLNS